MFTLFTNLDFRMNLEEQGIIIILKFRKFLIYLFKHLNMSIMVYPWPVTTLLGVCVWKLQYDCPQLMGKQQMFTQARHWVTYLLKNDGKIYCMMLQYWEYVDVFCSFRILCITYSLLSDVKGNVKVLTWHGVLWPIGPDIEMHHPFPNRWRRTGGWAEEREKANWKIKLFLSCFI